MAATDPSYDTYGIAGSFKDAGLQVSEDQVLALSRHLDLLHRWQPAINLVSSGSLKDAARRHVLDSAQLVSFIPPRCGRLVDLGSGAGFPGLVLAILRPDLEVHLIESDQKKCAFLEAVSRETGSRVVIHNMRIELAPVVLPVTDVITARALASLGKLFTYVNPWFVAEKAPLALFPKGGEVAEDITQAKTKWNFSYEMSVSVTDPSGRILRVFSLSQK